MKKTDGPDGLTIKVEGGPGHLHLHFQHRTITVPVKAFGWESDGTSIGTVIYDEPDNLSFTWDREQGLLCMVYEEIPVEPKEGE